MGSDDLEDFTSAARSWLADHVPQRWLQERSSLTEDETTEIRMQWDRALHAGGYAGLSLPPEYGGQGRGLAEEVVFAKLSAEAGAPDGYGRIGRILTAPTLIARGTAAQRDHYLPPILRGEQMWCQGFSEPDAGSDLAAVTSFATPADGGYRITGQKVWTSFARHADKCLFLARSSHEAPRHRNLSMFLVDMDQDGVETKPIKQISGSSHFAEVFFDDAFVSAEDRVGEEGDGWSVAMTVLQSERGGVEAMSRYVEMTGDVGLLESCCATGGECLPEAVTGFRTRLELVRWQVLKALSREDDQVAFTRATAVLKLMWSELWQEVTRWGIESGCATHRDHWRYQYLETRAVTIYAGSSEIQRNIVGDRVLGLPR